MLSFIFQFPFKQSIKTELNGKGKIGNVNMEKAKYNIDITWTPPKVTMGTTTWTSWHRNHNNDTTTSTTWTSQHGHFHRDTKTRTSSHIEWTPCQGCHDIDTTTRTSWHRLHYKNTTAWTPRQGYHDMYNTTRTPEQGHHHISHGHHDKDTMVYLWKLILFIYSFSSQHAIKTKIVIKNYKMTVARRQKKVEPSHRPLSFINKMHKKKMKWYNINQELKLEIENN